MQTTTWLFSDDMDVLRNDPWPVLAIAATGACVLCGYTMGGASSFADHAYELATQVRAGQTLETALVQSAL